MKYDYVFYTTDESFDYGDFPGSTCYEETTHGFYINYDKDDIIDLSTLEGFGSFEGIEKEIKTMEDFAKFLDEHKGDIQEYEGFPTFYINGEKITNDEVFAELREFVKDNIELEKDKAFFPKRNLEQIRKTLDEIHMSFGFQNENEADTFLEKRKIINNLIVDVEEFLEAV